MADLFHQLQAALADRYQLDQELGRGGMATVYLALDPRHQRRVAIKVLRPELADALGQERFLREIRFAAELSHPHILPLLDSGTVQTEQTTLPYFVMPYVEGESLRDRLAREKQLPLTEALEIARDVAVALAYAHGHGVVHRDIKPENILLAGTEAVVADFGIARAINRAADPEALTSSGLAVGTPAYMSPEQANAEGELDGRSDIYSLGCVLYEMLGGNPPFGGASANAILARHRVDTVPPLRTVRPTVPPAVELAVMRALEKIPADRFSTAAQFATALAAQISPTPTPISANIRGGWTREHPLVGSALMLMLTAGLAWGAWKVWPSGRRSCDGPGGSCELDTTRYAILSMEQETGLPAQLNPAQQLYDAIARWSGINLVEPFRVGDALSRRDIAHFRQDDWRRIAEELQAGRYIRGDVSRVGDSIRVHAVLYDTRHNLALADKAERLGSDLSNPDSTYVRLANALLFRNTGPHSTSESIIGTNSAPARQAFVQGQEAIQRWDLAAADSAFDAATKFDLGYAQAFLWLALVRSWEGDAPAQWSSPAERAAAGRARLPARDQQISDAVLASAHGDMAGACRTWERLTVLNPYDFVVWYGRGDCLHRDEVVLRDHSSRTGWRFRSSYDRALKSFQQAFRLLPSIHRSFRRGAFASVRDLLETSESELREGHALPPDTTTFLASPSWDGDSLAFVPIPKWRFAGGEPLRSPTTEEAVRRQREFFREIAAGWVAADPKSADAMEALAISLEMLGDRSALDTLRRARALASDPGERLRTAGAEVWARVKFSLPSDLIQLEAARRLADSLLQENAGVSPPEPRLLAGLAALTGRAYLAARLSRLLVARADWDVPLPLNSSAPELLVYAAMGGPADSLRVLEHRVIVAIEQGMSPGERPGARLQWLAFPATLAFPNHTFISISTLAGGGDYLLDGLAGLISGDRQAVRKALSESRRLRKSTRASELTLDALNLEASFLAAMGDSHAAGAWLDPTLDSLSDTAPQAFADAFRAGPLVRAMGLRADLAQRSSETATAKRWAAPVALLWHDADDFLQPLVHRMEQLAK